MYGFIIASTTILVISPRLVASSTYKLFMFLGVVVQSSGSIADSPTVPANAHSCKLSQCRLGALDVDGASACACAHMCARTHMHCTLRTCAHAGRANCTHTGLCVLTLQLRYHIMHERVCMRIKNKYLQRKLTDRLASHFDLGVYMLKNYAWIHI